MGNIRPLQVLLAATPTDAESLLHALAAGGFAPRGDRVETLADLRCALAQPGWQVLIAQAGASLDPSRVLSEARAQAPGRPVLVVATPAGPDEARALLQAGARDVIWLEHLDRLALAVENQLMAGAGAANGDEYQEMFFRNRAIQLLVDPGSAEIADANPAAAEFYGYERAELRGMTLRRLSYPPEAPALGVDLAVLAASGEAVNVTQHRLASGAVRDVEVQTSTVARGGRQLLYAIVHDVTDRLQRERELETVAQFAAALRTAPSRAAMLPVILEQLQTLIGAAGAALVLRDAQSGDLVVALAQGWREAAGTSLAPDSGLASQVIASGQPQWRSLPGYPGQPADQAPAQAAAPLAAQGHALGAVCVSLAQAPTPLQLRLLTAIGDMTANALQRATLHEQTEQRVRRLAALHAVDLAIASSFDLRVTLGILLDHLNDQLAVDAASILILNSATQTLEYAAVRGLDSRLLQRLPLRLSDSLPGRVAAQRQPLHVANLAELQLQAGRPYPPGGEKFAGYYGAPLQAKGRVLGVLEIFQRGPLPADPDWIEYVESLATQAAIAIDNAALFGELQRSNVDLNLAYDATIEGWSRVLEARGIESAGHTRRVADQTVRLAQAAGFGGADLIHLRRGALLHDIGMLAVPEGVLLKPGPLSDEERGVMRQHPEHGFDFLAPINYLRPSLDIPYCHHEKWDGSGYPRGLRGDHIPLGARLFALVDTWDALRADRPFRAAWTAERARAYIQEKSGVEFDPQMTALFLQIGTNGKSH